MDTIPPPALVCQILPESGMPRLVIRFNAPHLTIASALWLSNFRAATVVPRRLLNRDTAFSARLCRGTTAPYAPLVAPELLNLLQRRIAHLPPVFASNAWAFPCVSARRCGDDSIPLKRGFIARARVIGAIASGCGLNISKQTWNHVMSPWARLTKFSLDARSCPGPTRIASGGCKLDDSVLRLVWLSADR